MEYYLAITKNEMPFAATWMNLEIIILLGSYNSKNEPRVEVSKRQRHEKPTKIEQRKVPGLEGGPQVK